MLWRRSSNRLSVKSRRSKQLCGIPGQRTRRMVWTLRLPAHSSHDPSQTAEYQDPSMPRKSTAKTVKHPPERARHGDGIKGELVILTGMSGSGKLSALKAFEDMGFYSVDNLPLELIPQFADLVRQSPQITRAALVVDVREATRLD